MDADGVIRLRRVLVGLTRQLDTPSGQEGLSPAQASVLASVGSSGPLGLSELSGIESLGPGQLSRVVSMLETFGLVRRERDRRDGGSARIEGTRAGEATWRLIGTEQAELISELVSSLSAPEQCTLAAAVPALEQLAAGLRHHPRDRLGAGGPVT
jgi:DNA-binding MarR family transcriptional regulator